jgi:hypothetical protein
MAASAAALAAYAAAAAAQRAANRKTFCRMFFWSIGNNLLMCIFGTFIQVNKNVI